MVKPDSIQLAPRIPPPPPISNLIGVLIPCGLALCAAGAAVYQICKDSYGTPITCSFDPMLGIRRTAEQIRNAAAWLTYIAHKVECDALLASGYMTIIEWNTCTTAAEDEFYKKTGIRPSQYRRQPGDPDFEGNGFPTDGNWGSRQINPMIPIPV